MISSLIEIAIGYFATYHVPSMLKLKKGVLASIIRLIGVIFIIGGFVGLIRCFISF